MIASCISDIQHYLPFRQVSTPELEKTPLGKKVDSVLEPK